MKRIVLFFTVMFLVGTAVQANDHRKSDHHNRVTPSVKKAAYRYGAETPIIFVENGITFMVFPNGEMDFRAPGRRAYRPVDWNTYESCAPGYSSRYSRNRGFAKNYDYYGRLRRVGRNYISYNRFDQVRKIGSVYIQYNRRGLVSRIGGLYISYGKYGRIRNIEGDVHYRGCGFCGADGCSAAHDPYYDFGQHPHRDDDHDYYKNRQRNRTHSTR